MTGKSHDILQPGRKNENFSWLRVRARRSPERDSSHTLEAKKSPIVQDKSVRRSQLSETQAVVLTTPKPIELPFLPSPKVPDGRKPNIFTNIRRRFKEDYPDSQLSEISSTKSVLTAQYQGTFLAGFIKAYDFLRQVTNLGRGNAVNKLIDFYANPQEHLKEIEQILSRSFDNIFLPLTNYEKNKGKIQSTILALSYIPLPIPLPIGIPIPFLPGVGFLPIGGQMLVLFGINIPNIYKAFKENKKDKGWSYIVLSFIDLLGLGFLVNTLLSEPFQQAHDYVLETGVAKMLGSALQENPAETEKSNNNRRILTEIAHSVAISKSEEYGASATSLHERAEILKPELEAITAREFELEIEFLELALSRKNLFKRLVTFFSKDQRQKRKLEREGRFNLLRKVELETEIALTSLLIQIEPAPPLKGS